MPRLKKSPPKYRHHKATGQAVVTIDGKDFYLGPWRSKASRCEYDRLIGEWMQNGRSLPRHSACDTTVVEVFSAYLKFAGTYYVKNGEPTREVGLVKDVSRFVVPLYGRTAATEFGPLALKSVRQRMIEAGHGRRNINKNVDRIRRVFKWAAAEEMIPPTVPQALAMLPGLRQGRSEARETTPVQPVADDIVELTIAYLPDVVADMVRFQRLTGCRPGEVCILNMSCGCGQAVVRAIRAYRVSTSTKAATSTGATGYRRHAHEYYRKNGKVTRQAEQIDEVLRFLRKEHGKGPVDGFGPVALDELRDQMIDDMDWSRKHINKQVLRLMCAPETSPIAPMQRSRNHDQVELRHNRVGWLAIFRFTPRCDLDLLYADGIFCRSRHNAQFSFGWIWKRENLLCRSSAATHVVKIVLERNGHNFDCFRHGGKHRD